MMFELMPVPAAEEGSMYSVNRLTHDQHGSVIHIERILNGSEFTPFQAVQRACKEQRLWLEGGAKKVRILIDDQVMSFKQAEHWAHEEYKTLPKCFGCAKILGDCNVITHQLNNSLFCSQQCADTNYNELIEKHKNEEDSDCL
jgi:hypothetical protein